MKIKNIMLLIVSSFFLCATAQALPALQVDISDGAYDTSTETIVATGSSFSVYALLEDKKGDYLSEDFFLVVSLVPAVTDASGIGSFSFSGGTLVNQAYGTPSGLSSHGIFDTYYWEYKFNFNPSNKAVSYNAQDDPGGLVTGGSDPFYFAEFIVDVSGLDPSVMLHFDLYGGGKFAPYSHDGQSTATPVPPSILLLGTGLVGLVGFRKRRKL